MSPTTSSHVASNNNTWSKLKRGARRWTKWFGDQLLATRWTPALRMYYELRPPHMPSVAGALLDLAQRKQDVRFIQVGAHCGGVRDPLFRHIVLDKWQGLLIEPQTKAFQQLKHFYQGIPNLQFVQQVFSNQQGKRPWYTIQEEGETTPWANQLSSLEARVPAGVLDRLTAAQLTEEQVECTTLTALLQSQEWDHFDVLLIDAEGHDAAILAGLDWTSYQPDLVIYEHCHLTPADQPLADKLLASYHHWRGPFNTIATKDPTLLPSIH